MQFFRCFRCQVGMLHQVRGEVPWANSPSMTSGQQWTKRFHNGSRTDLTEMQKCSTKTKIDLFCFLSKQDMMKLYVDAQKKMDQKSYDPCLSFRARCPAFFGYISHFAMTMHRSSFIYSCDHKVAILCRNDLFCPALIWK